MNDFIIILTTFDKTFTMAAFTLAVAAVKTAYDTFLTARAATATAAAAIVSAGAIPAYPTVVIADADWNAVTASRATWNTANDALQATLVTRTAAQRTAELAVIAALGYGTGSTGVDGDTGIAVNQWVKVVGAGAGILTYTNWIGAASNSTYLTIITSIPANPFPNI